MSQTCYQIKYAQKLQKAVNVFVERHTGVCPQMVSQWSLSACSAVKTLKLEITDYTFRMWFMQERRCRTQSADPHSEEALVLPQKISSVCALIHFK